MNVKKVGDSVRRRVAKLRKEIDRLTRQKRAQFDEIEKILEERKKSTAAEAESYEVLDARGAPFSPGMTGWVRPSIKG